MKEPDAAGVGQTVLLVEDQSSVRRALGEVLRRGGYHVLKACDGAEGLRIHKRHRGRIHAVVTDVQMPGMTGVDLAARLRELQPALKVLFVCGSVPKSISFARIRSQPGTAFLQKPFFANSLLRTLENLMDMDTEHLAEPSKEDEVLEAGMTDTEQHSIYRHPVEG